MKQGDIASIVVILWMLSLITEKIANLIKLNRYDLRNSERNSPEGEKNREKKIQQLSIIVGVLVALVVKANFFLFFKDMDLAFQWEESDFESLDKGKLWNLLYHLLGCSITGLFLSFGSKFFHDLLDIVLQYKNIKRKIAERGDWNFDNIEQVETYINAQEATRIEDFLEKELLDKFSEVANFEFDPQHWEVKVYVTAAAKLPQILYYKSSFSKVKPIVVKVVQSSPVVALAGRDIYPSETISNRKNSNQQGAIGCVVRDAEARLCLLTCYHAVKSEVHSWAGVRPNSPDLEVSVAPGKQPIGTILKGYRDETLDAALILPADNTDLFTAMPNDPTFFNGKSRPVYGDDYTQQAPVRLKSAVRQKIVRGKIAHIARSVNITYSDGVFKMVGLLEIISTSNDSFSVAGDSGSLVVDEKGTALGMLIAANLTEGRSYAIPISRIEENLNIKVV